MFKWIASFCLIAMLSPLFAGVVFEVEVKDKSGNDKKIENMTILSEGRNIRMNMTEPGQGNNSMIFNGDKRAMIVLDHARKQYIVMDKTMMKGMMGQLNQAMGQMKDVLKNLPPEQAAMAEKMMKEKMGNSAAAKPRLKSELRKIGDKKEHNGYPVVKYEVYKGDRKVREMWVTDWDNVDGGKEIAQGFKEMGVFFQEMLDEFSKLDLPIDVTSQMDRNMFNVMNELDGFPVVTKEFNAAGEVISASSLRSSKQMSLSSGDFEAPADYRAEEMGGNMFDR